ncbi:MAG: DUF4394 domain-containing protein [Vicinamibacteraceae bacterium]
MSSIQPFVVRADAVRAAGRILAVCVVALGALGSATRADAATAFALTSTNQIVTFDTNTPGSPSSIVAITGLQPAENALAIDLRPATGQIYLLGSTSRLYVVSPVTGIAVAVGGPFTPALSGASFGFDFNPTVDRIRVVSDTGQNLRLNPDTGAVASEDTPLNIVAGTPHIVGSAYANNFAGATATALYAIDSTTNALYVQNPPNAGVLTLVGPLGFDVTDAVGFDISANDNRAYAIVTVVASALVTIDLTTGTAAPVAVMPGGPFRGLTVLSRGVPMVALRGNELIRFHSATPGTILGTATLSGLQLAEQLVGIDMRPADGQLYGVGSTSRLYLLNAITGAATQIGPVFPQLLSGTRFGVDFNPMVDRLRIVSDDEQNFRINPNTGGLSGVDSNLTPAGTVGAAAYSNNVDGTGATLLYDIDAGSDQLLIQGQVPPGPNTGVLTAVGPLGVNTSSDVAFDISPFDNTAFAALNVGGIAGLYTINLTTGAAAPIGTIGTGTVINGLTAMPLAYQFAEGTTGTFFDTDLLLANPTTAPVAATITYLTENARVVTSGVMLPAQSRTTISADANTQLGNTAFSSTVTSHLGIPIVVERTMRWDPTGYGMHTEKAATALARDWFFAEGAQGFYDTFFLLTNPAPAANVANVRFFLENGTQVTRTYNLTAQSRLTVYAGSIPELVNQSFGAQVTFTFAGAAERAMYFGTPTFNGGHESAGVTRPSTDWFLAEGATGSFFTTFVLLSNPNVTPAAVTLTYLREGGGTVTALKTIPAGTRLSINIATEDPSLAATSVATRVTSDVPIVVERSMYWPMTPASWNEASNAFGVTGTALRWGLAEGRVGGPNAFQTYILVANPGLAAANITLTILRTTGAPLVKTLAVPAGARLTITTGPGSAVPELTDESFGATIVSDVPVFAERALYSNAGGVFWAAGSAATATLLP